MGVAERKLREKEKRRNDILDAAEELFFSRGAQQTTMDDVAGQTELSKGTLYLYFRSKDELYLGINVRAKRLMREQMEAAAALPGSGRDKVLALGKAFLRFSLEFADYAKVIQDCMPSEAEQIESNPYAREAHEHGQRSLNLLFEAMRQGQSDGSISQDLDPIRTSLLLWAQFTGLLQILATKGSHLEAELGLSQDALSAYVFELSERLLKP